MTSFTQASTDRTLDRTAGKHSALGTRLLLVGVVLALAGIILSLLGGNTIEFVGLLLVALGAPVLLGGIGLSVAGMVGGRAAKHKDFA